MALTGMQVLVLKSQKDLRFALTGKVNNTGLAEVPMGITMREISL